MNSQAATSEPLAASDFRCGTLAFIESNRALCGEAGYRYSRLCRRATLYSSCYAILTRHLLGDLESLTQGERRDWLAFFNSYQDEDGLFRDPVIYGEGWYRGDPAWCGRMHLTCHVISAMASLGGVAQRPIRHIEPYCDAGFLVDWLERRPWGGDIATVGNEIMNIGVLLQYVRDFQANKAAAPAVEVLLNWLGSNYISSRTGLWGELDVGDKNRLSRAVMGAYHWWPLFFYDGVPVPFIERAIDSVLLTQNPNGGFGWGVHNGAEPFNSSACEDIDSIDPLVRMSALTDYRRDDIRKAIVKAAHWVMRNRQADGGFVFILGRPFRYGHDELDGPADGGAMFPTWFRTLSLALMEKAAGTIVTGNARWCFNACPGMQFWR